MISLLEKTPDAIRAYVEEVSQQVEKAARSRLMLVGSSRLAQRCIEAVRASGGDIAGLIEMEPRQWGKTVAGVPVMPPDEAARRFGTDALCVVAIWSPDHQFVDTRDWLRAVGFQRVMPVQVMFWTFPTAMGEYYQFSHPSVYLDQMPKIAKLFDQLGDDESRRQFAGNLNWRLLLNADGQPAARPDRIYFDPALMNLPDDVVMADIGAFDGDTLRKFLYWRGNRFGSVYAFEPDPINLQRLKAYAESLPSGLARRVHCVNKAVGEHPGTVQFEPSGKPGTIMTGAGSVSVPCVRLDDEFADTRVNYLKFDIEGWENEALAGARQIVKRDRPAVGMSIYHKPTDLFLLPLDIIECCPDYKFYFRAHDDDGIDFIFYAVPMEYTR